MTLDSSWYERTSVKHTLMFWTIPLASRPCKSMLRLGTSRGQITTFGNCLSLIYSKHSTSNRIQTTCKYNSQSRNRKLGAKLLGQDLSSALGELGGSN